MGTSKTHHELTYQGADTSGAEAWRCDECGRHVVVRWSPDFDHFALTVGDVSVSHSGSKNGLARIGPIAVSSVDSDLKDDMDGTWQRWLEANGIDWSR